MKIIILISIIIGSFTTILLSAETKKSQTEHLGNLGINYDFKQFDKPIPNRVHILRIDIASDRIEPKVELGPDPDGNGPAEVALTDPRKLASNPSVIAFINTNPWDSFPNKDGKKNRSWHLGQPVDIHGLAGTKSIMRSTTAPSNTSVWFDASGKVHFGHQAKDKPNEAATGFQLIVSDGKLTVGKGGPRHPRTAIGANKSGEILWLVVVDGRQKGFSEGMDMHELATIMKELGCWRATNMDGGGSSVMGLINKSGEMKIMNSPSDRFLGLKRIRPLPMVLTIRKKSL
ncbi:MAG: phosphodiester glycosidase family protein [Verrucomicrobiota bacterium]|nr:phosphodiester glycosidase family protein [Verrucomicrobiota bacterium]